MSTPDSTEAPQAVVITGGGTGIGRAAARAFAGAGAAVLIVGRTESTLKETADGFPGIRWLAIDITEPDAAPRIVETAVRELGGIDVLVNNAAIASVGMLGDISRATASAQLATNLYAPIFLSLSPGAAPS
jgi:C-7 ketoreductase